MISFNQYFLCEIADSKRNRESVIQAYGLLDHSTPTIASERAKEIIDRWTKLSPLIDPSKDYFGFESGFEPGQLNPKDIFSWSKIYPEDKLEALQNLEAMIADLKRKKEQNAQAKVDEKKFKTAHKGKLANVYIPDTEAASCKLARKNHGDSQWCISATKGGNQFTHYRNDLGVIHFFIIPNVDVEDTVNPWYGRKIAATMYPDGETWEYHNELDEPLTADEFANAMIDLAVPLSIFREYLPDAMTVIRGKVSRISSILSGQVRVPENQYEDPTKMLRELYDFLTKRVASSRLFQDYRGDEGEPDSTFAMLPLNEYSILYFTDSDLNPPGSNPRGNEMYQEAILQKFRRLSYVTGNLSDNSEDEMDEHSAELKILGDGNSQFFFLSRWKDYITKHIGSKDGWPALEKALINLWDINRATTELNRSDTPIRDTEFFLKLIILLRKGRWEELEEYILSNIEAESYRASPMGVTNSFDSTRSAADHSLRALLDMGEVYNNYVARIPGNLDWEDFKAWVPETEDHVALFRKSEYKWPKDPPLTTVAANEVQYREFERNRVAD